MKLPNPNKLLLIFATVITIMSIILIGYTYDSTLIQQKNHNRNLNIDSISKCPSIHSNCAEIQLEKKIDYLIELLENQK